MPNSTVKLSALQTSMYLTWCIKSTKSIQEVAFLRDKVAMKSSAPPRCGRTLATTRKLLTGILRSLTITSPTKIIWKKSG